MENICVAEEKLEITSLQQEQSHSPRIINDIFLLEHILDDMGSDYFSPQDVREKLHEDDPITVKELENWLHYATLHRFFEYAYGKFKFRIQRVLKHENSTTAS